jgi:hypothetical protein
MMSNNRSASPYARAGWLPIVPFPPPPDPVLGAHGVPARTRVRDEGVTCAVRLGLCLRVSLQAVSVLATRNAA